MRWPKGPTDNPSDPIHVFVNDLALPVWDSTCSVAAIRSVKRRKTPFTCNRLAPLGAGSGPPLGEANRVADRSPAILGLPGRIHLVLLRANEVIE